MMTIEVPQNKKIFGRGKEEGKKGIGFAIRRKRANRGSINDKE